ncbi:MAG TPA: carbon storage regulator [Pirellulales bacterium]|nr:carbon storage regulator [Pirellulales bacterium]
MLVLTRKDQQEIFIGKVGDVLTEPITVQVTEILHGRVRLGITAQRDIAIMRPEARCQLDSRLRKQQPPS